MYTSSKGNFVLDGIQSPENIKTALPRLDSLIKVSVQKLPIIYPAIKRGIPVVNVTQCISGSVQMGNYETSVALKKIGVISGQDITTEAALAKMMYLLGQGLGPKVFKSIFETPLRGELT